MMNQVMSEKILVLGIDGMDPRYTHHLLKKGKMPNTRTLIERGACRADLAMLGSHPTITPPMWTTTVHGSTSSNAWHYLLQQAVGSGLGLGGVQF